MRLSLTLEYVFCDLEIGGCGNETDFDSFLVNKLAKPIQNKQIDSFRLCTIFKTILTIFLLR
jgi:hypothetical protein